MNTTRGDVALTRSKKKKKSPSTLRRNSRRWAEKPEPSTERRSSEEETAPEKEAENRSKKLFKCDQCDNQLKSDNGLRIQVGKSHKNENSGSSL